MFDLEEQRRDLHHYRPRRYIARPKVRVDQFRCMRHGGRRGFHRARVEIGDIRVVLCDTEVRSEEEDHRERFEAWRMNCAICEIS